MTKKMEIIASVPCKNNTGFTKMGGGLHGDVKRCGQILG